MLKAPGILSSTETVGLPDIPDGGRIEDVRDRKVLVGDPSYDGTHRLYALADPGSPKLIATFITGSYIVPNTQAVYAERWENGTYTMTLSQAADLPFDIQRLVKLHAAMAAHYSECAARQFAGTDCFDLQFEGMAQLRQAGIKQLLAEQPQGLTLGQRVLMLNDYGFWLYKWSGRDKVSLALAAENLNKVVELAPDRASAWLNLGDLQRKLAGFAETDPEKAALWRDARQDFDRYKQLSGKDAPAAAEMAAFDLSAFVNSSAGICEYVAAAANHGALGLISSSTGKVEAEGKAITFSVGDSGGSCGTAEIKAEGYENFDQTGENEEQLKPFHFAGGDFGDMSLKIVPYHGKYYTLSGNPDEVVDPNSGPVCAFKHAFHPVLVENKSPALCETFLRDKLPFNLDWSPLPDQQVTSDRIDLARALADFDRVVSADLGGKRTARIGHFTMAATGGCGCDHNGVAVLDGNRVVIDAEPNKSLLAYQGKWWHCGGADADLTRSGGVTYVTAWDGSGKNSKSVLLQLVNGAFKPVCRVDQVMTVTPTAPVPHPPARN